MAVDISISNLTTLIRGLIHDQERFDGKDPFEYKSDNRFYLSENFINETSISVEVNGIVLSNSNWLFDTNTNILTINSSLTEDDIIEVFYSYYAKFSDNEIEGYINSALTYFVQYQYKKIFMIEDDNIVVEEGITPTTREIYFIALIASILIDPQNENIDIPDLRVRPNRNQSDQEQIQDAFAQFKRFVGTIEFREQEDEY